MASSTIGLGRSTSPAWAAGAAFFSPGTSSSTGADDDAAGAALFLASAGVAPSASIALARRPTTIVKRDTECAMARILVEGEGEQIGTTSGPPCRFFLAGG